MIEKIFIKKQCGGGVDAGRINIFVGEATVGLFDDLIFIAPSNKIVSYKGVESVKIFVSYLSKVELLKSSGTKNKFIIESPFDDKFLNLLQVVKNYKDKSYINTIVKNLQIFSWFEYIRISEKEIFIKDNFLNKEFTLQHASNGFILFLFYVTLIVAKETPDILVIDDIDATFNPKLSTKFMTIIVDLAKKYNKQIFLTAFNPAVLDGIDLNDEEQKLFIVSRSKKSCISIKELLFKDKPKSLDNEPLPLSSAFLYGYLKGEQK